MPHTARHHPRPSSSKKFTTTTTADGWSIIARQHRRNTPNLQDTKHTSSQASDTGDPTPRLDYLSACFRRLDLGAVEDLTSAQRELCCEFLEGRRGERVLRPQRARETGEEVRVQYERVRKIWLGSRGRERVRGVLRPAGCIGEEDGFGGADDGVGEELDGVREGNDVEVDKAVCLGLGSLSADTSGWRAVVVWQLVVFLGIVEMLTRPNSKQDTIKLYAQDPVFNTIDIAFLASFNITVLPTPETFELIDGKTLVYAPHFPLACWPAQMRRGKAAVVVGNDVERALPRIPSPEALRKLFSRLITPVDGGNTDGSVGAEVAIPDLDAKEEFRELLRTHESVAWPEPEEAEHAFNNMRVYWRRRARDEG